ncbi:hypothetical protein, partial [Bacteroides pyogenes]
HGIFTLQHTFDAEYGKGTQGTTNNLLDYAETGKELAAFQWNVMANPAVFTSTDKASKGKLELKTGEYIGFTPNGQVIKISGWVKFSRESSSYFISGLELPDGTKYTWVKAANKFVSKEGKEYPLIVNEAVSGKVAIWADSKNPDCYTWYKFIEVKNYTSKDFESIKRRIANDDGQNWYPDLVFGASDDCMAKSKKETQEGIELPQIKDITSNDLNDTTDGLFDNLYFVGKASDFQADILAEIKQIFKKHEENTFTRKEVSKDISIIISIDGDDSQEISSLKNQKNSYLHLIFTIKNGKVEFLRMETSDKFGDKLSHICELIKNEPWAAQAIVLYEVADLLDKGIEYLKIPESVWSCDNESNVYKKVISYLLDTQFPVLIGNDFIGNKLNEESKFAFVCGLWNGTVDIVQSVPQLVKLLTCALHADCRESASPQWESFKNAVIEDESGHILCPEEEYFCKARQMISIALNELVADNCKVAHTVGSVVGPIAVMCIGDVAAGEAVLTRLGSVGSGLKYAIKGLQLCDKVTDITRPIAKGIKVSTALVRKAGKLLPEIQINGKTFLHYVGDKLHIRRFDAVTKQAIDEPVDESNLSQKVEEYLTVGVQTTTIDKFISSLSSNTSFLKVLKDIRIKGSSIEVDDFVDLFVKLHKSAPTNSVKSLDNVMDDFVYLVDHHLSDFMKTTKGKKQITAFINELLQSKDKFKAGTTTLEVIHNAQKYIPSKYYNTLSDLELEDLIAYADDAGDFRFDIKWKAFDANKKVDIFVDTKNYSSASNMFKDLGQFKAYIRNIDNFDQLYIIQQGGREVTKEQIVAQLERAIAKDAESVLFENRVIWQSLGINSSADLERFCQARRLSQHAAFQSFRNCILITK